MYILAEFTRQNQVIFYQNRDYVCPECQTGRLIGYDHCRRIMRHEGGRTEWLLIPRCRCNNPGCGKIHRMLPDILQPHKHYDAEVISGVIDGVVTNDDAESEDYPCADTMRRWLEWFRKNLENIEGFLRLTALTLEFLIRLADFGDSLLAGLRAREHCWLEIVTAVVYNTGHRLEPL